jgi:Spy/CpxP family protein refolding chaperone
MTTMTKNKGFFRVAAVALLSTGLLLAQAPGPRGERGQGKQGPRGNHMERMATILDLNESQKTQIQGFLQQAREESKPVREQMKQNREALREAVQTNNTARIQTLSEESGRLMAQVTAAHSTAMARSYAVLSPEQREKAEKLFANFGQGQFGPGMGGKGRGAGRGAR